MTELIILNENDFHVLAVKNIRCILKLILVINTVFVSIILFFNIKEEIFVVYIGDNDGRGPGWTITKVPSSSGGFREIFIISAVVEHPDLAVLR
ncbi:hypothetical protein LGZ62_005145 [Salmonella enterica subsp. enterica serovar Newport]